MIVCGVLVANRLVAGTDVAVFRRVNHWPGVYLGAHFPLDVAAGAGLGVFIGGALNLVFGVPTNSSPSTARASRLP